MGCRLRGERTYELTMGSREGKNNIMEGLRVNGAMVHAKDITVNKIVVSFHASVLTMKP